MKKSARVLEWIGVALLAAVVLTTAFMFIGPLFGLECHKVLSSSMEPTLKVGGMVVTKPVRLEDVKAGDHEERTGDIIVFRLKTAEKEQVVHRVVDIVEMEGKPWFQTWGDANEEPEPDFVTSEGDTIRRVVFHVPYMGYLAAFVETRLAFVILIVIPGLILVAWFTRDLWKAVITEKARRSKDHQSP